MTERPPFRPAALALLISVIASGLLCVWAVTAAPDHLRAPVAWSSAAAAVLLSATVTTAVYATVAQRALRVRVDRMSAEAAQFGARSAEWTHEFYGGVLFNVEAGDGAQLSVIADESADVGMIGHNMSELVEQLGEHLIAEPRT